MQQGGVSEAISTGTKWCEAFRPFAFGFASAENTTRF